MNNMLWTFLCMIFGDCIYTFLLGIYQEWTLKYRVFSFSKYYQTVFQSSCISLHSHQQYMTVQLSHVLANTGIVWLFNFWHSGRYVKILIVVLILISRRTSDIECLLIHLLTIWTSSEWRVYWRFLSIFLLGYLSFSHWFVVLYNLFYSVTCSFILLMVSFDDRKFLISI